MQPLAFHPVRRGLRALRVAAPAGLAVGVLLAAAPAASAGSATCTSRPHTIAKKHGDIVFVKAHSLWACTRYSDDPSRTVRLGRWNPSTSKLAFDGNTVVWTLPGGPAFEGVQEDRLWAADANAARIWLKGVRPVAGAPLEDLDGHAVGLTAYGDAVAWVTTGGAVTFAVQSPESGATSAGSGTPAAAPAAIDGVAQGLFSPLQSKRNRTTIGRWTNLSPEALAATIKIESLDGDGDECGGYNQWGVTVTPLVGQPAVGAQRRSDWVSSSLVCTGF